MKLLTVDLETSPATASVWGMFNQNIGLNQLLVPTRVLCFAAKWHGATKVDFYSEHHHGKEEMVQAAHRLLTEADAVIHFNGARFDVPHLNREFLLAGLNPPAPFHQIDLLRVIRKQFKFQSGKLAHVTAELGLSGKLSHSGHTLWLQCLEGDEKAWNLMRRYNKQDVVTTEELYNRLLPWITNHPHVGLIDKRPAESCPNCASTAIQWRGWAFTKSSQYRRFQCQDCGSWGRATSRETGTKVVGI